MDLCPPALNPSCFPPRGTFDLDVEDVVAVLDAVLHVAAVDARVVGPQLGEQQGGVGVALVEDGQGGAQAIVLAHLHSVPPRYQDLHLPALRDEGPLDPGGSSQDCPAPGRAGGGLGAEVGDEAGDGDVARQHGVKGWVPRDGDLQSLEVLWVGEERSCERDRHGCLCLRVPPETPTTGHQQGKEMWPMVPSYLCHLRGRTPPGPPWGQTPRAAAAAGLGPSSALQRGRKNHRLCLKQHQKNLFFCTRGKGQGGTLGGRGDGRGIGAQRERHRHGHRVTWTPG